MSDCGFGKFYARTFTGSMMGAGSHVIAVWAYAVANAKPPDGEVELNPKLLAHLIGDTEKRIAEAIEYLCRLDPHSRSKAHQGRRLLKVGQFAYRLVNWPVYREVRDSERRDYMRNYMRQRRDVKGMKS